MHRLDWRFAAGGLVAALVVVVVAIFGGADSGVVVANGSLSPCCASAAVDDDSSESGLGESPEDLASDDASATAADSEDDQPGDEATDCADGGSGPDLDADGVADECDADNGNGPAGDIDGDGVANFLDNCSEVPNPDQADADGDGTGDVCDAASSLASGAPSDVDGDGIADANDNCPNASNADQSDADGDGTGTACDDNPDDGPNGDLDSDGTPNAADNCPNDANSQQTDRDADGIGNACDSSDNSAAPEPPADDPTPQPDPDPDPAPDPPTQPVTGGQGCILSLHGAGTPPPSIVETWANGQLLYLQPHSGNPEQPWFWLYDGPHNMAYDPGDSNQPYNQLVAYLTDVLDENGCGPTMLYGASNGGGFAARIYCSGDDFGGRLWSAYIDDPVPDAGVIGCSPSPAVQRTIFIHSTELATQAAEFVDDRCSQSPTLQWPWYCQDDIGFSVDEYEAHIGQSSVWGREDHIGRNTDETNFFKNVERWWYEYDPVTYADLA